MKEGNCSLAKVTIQQNQSRFRFFTSHFGKFMKVNPDYLQLQLFCSFKIPNFKYESRGFISYEKNVCLCNDNNDICNCIMTIATFSSIDGCSSIIDKPA